MSRTDELPPDQRAALLLLLRQPTSYAELARLLGIPERAVHDRAHAALAVLAPREARGLPAERREQVGEYLLGQQSSVSERLATRTYLNASEPARAWARAIVAALTPLASVALPEIPTGASAPAGAPETAGLAERAASPLVPDGGAAPARTAPPSSRLGGALLLIVIAAAVIIAVVLLTGSGGKSHAHTTTSAAATGAKTKGGPAVDARLALTSPDPKSRSIGGVDVLSEGEKRAFYVEAERLPPSKGFFYALWLYNSPHSFLPLSKAPPVGSNKRLAGGALLPAEAANYHEILLTRETSTHPTHPGHVVLRGRFTVGS